MPLVVGVSFRRVGKVYYFDPGELELREGDFVIAETARGLEFGEVVIEPREVPEHELVAPLKKIVRIATGDDLEREASNREREKEAFEICERKIAEHGLPMKLLDAEMAFDGSQITFSFSAEGRVDFRELVKDVASTLKTRVQLHQIGVRDEARIIGGFGPCGRQLCCSTFLATFEPISMKMAKDQSLFLNPTKFSGVCGKLMCCLRFEHDFYKDAQKRLPAVGAIVPTSRGRAKVVSVNFLTEILTLETEDEVQFHVRASELNLSGLCRKHGMACNMTEPNCAPILVGDETTTGEEEAEEEEEYEEDEELVENDELIDYESDLVEDSGPTPDYTPQPNPSTQLSSEETRQNQVHRNNGRRPRRNHRKSRFRKHNDIREWRDIRDRRNISEDDQ